MYKFRTARVRFNNLVCRIPSGFLRVARSAASRRPGHRDARGVRPPLGIPRRRATPCEWSAFIRTGGVCRARKYTMEPNHGRSTTLFRQLLAAPDDPARWRAFVGYYGPWARRWCGAGAGGTTRRTS
jgi:hypothetical protein